ncbi:efflux RND transporter periplasmic adaptor subunit [Stakelama tenebrarum]|uniref:Efflux RND transporter periplasmic adaptor subunit n=1 Tax=Stakelama tenebrarum TaxID=2711215 RepID=A0A6G6Y918_9SPHN|nr:efflux RND transporter periplasmic adaptor subunit [Sphingosinithalassobacter tenebrarum]QIG81073.1 efflux RND transporter periplasmic adaptor subunit [Sphingosinithalassobacter tenebrarum]
MSITDDTDDFAVETPRRRKAPLLIAAIVLVLVFGAIFAWRSMRMAGSAAAYAPPPVEVTAMRVKSETLPQALRATGSIEAVRQVVLAPEVPGRIVAIRFTAGQRVGRGAPLVQLFDAPERADRSAAVARLNFAQIQYDRSKELEPTGAEPRALLQQHEAELAQARAAIRQIDARLAQKTVRAPFSGQIGIRQVDLGQYVNAGDAIATLTDLDRVHVNFSVPQQDLSKLEVGGDVSVRSDALPDREFTAKVSAIEPVVAGDTRNIAVQAVMANPGRVLRPGIFVTVGVEQPVRQGAILVPTTAIQTSASGDSVFVVREGKAALVPVTVGSEVGERTVVERGLSAGDIVVTTGQVRLQPGAAVTIADTSKPATR